MHSTPGGAAVAAAALSLRGPRGWVYQDVTFEAGPGDLIAVAGPAGSGRTCLLLTFSGRMRPTSGVAKTGGIELPKHMAAVRRFAALGPVAGVNDFDPALTVQEHLRERVLVQRRFGDELAALLRPGHGRRAAERKRADDALALTGLDIGSLPHRERTPIRDLSALDVLRLGTALGLVGRPRLIAVDDVDRGLGTGDRETAWRMLRSVAATGTTVLASCAEAPADAVPVRLGASQDENANTNQTEEGATSARAATCRS